MITKFYPAEEAKVKYCGIVPKKYYGLSTDEKPGINGMHSETLTRDVCSCGYFWEEYFAGLSENFPLNGSFNNISCYNSVVLTNNGTHYLLSRCNDGGSYKLMNPKKGSRYTEFIVQVQLGISSDVGKHAISVICGTECVALKSPDNPNIPISKSASASSYDIDLYYDTDEAVDTDDLFALCFKSEQEYSTYHYYKLNKDAAHRYNEDWGDEEYGHTFEHNGTKFTWYPWSNILLSDGAVQEAFILKLMHKMINLGKVSIEGIIENNVVNGSEFIEIDTGNRYFYDGSSGDWVLPSEQSVPEL